MGKDGALQHAPAAASPLIRGRIAACRELIAAYIKTLPTIPPTPLASARGLSTPAPLPTVPYPCTDAGAKSLQSPYSLYNDLGYCAAYVKALPTVASPSPTPAGFIRLGLNSDGLPKTKAIYVMALATDAPTQAQLSMRLASHLRDHIKSSGVDENSGKPVNYVLIPEPTWQLAQYQQQCQNDPSTEGAVVAITPGSQSAVSNYFFIVNSWTALTSQAMVLDCVPTSTTYRNNVAYITYISNLRENIGSRISVPLGTYLAVIAGVTALHPIHTTTTTTSFAFQTPAPTTSPPVGAQFRSGVMIQDQTNTNPNGPVGILATSLLTPLSQVNPGQGISVDAQTARAAEALAGDIVNDLKGNCGATCPWLTP
jgi:hypothetical protein